MGFFDTIKCEYPLPKPEDMKELVNIDLNELSYQTKDLENALSYYNIKSDGTLWINSEVIEHIKGDPKGKTFSEKFGHIKVIKSEWDQIKDFTGTVNFYKYLHRNPENNSELNNDYSIEYTAIFVKGKLDTVQLSSFEYTDNSERKSNEAKWKAEKIERDILWNKWYMKYLYTYYDKSVFKIFRTYRKIINKLPSSHKVEQWFKFL
jgi:hypothetical protein